MFDINTEVNRLQQLKHAKLHGLPNKPKIYNPKVKQVDGRLFEITAITEGIAISRGFHNHSLGFGRRLSKAKGQKHYPGGGYAGHTNKGG